MRRFNPVKFIIVLIAILVTIRFVRYIPFAPIILMVFVISMARHQRKQNQRADEEFRTKEKDCTEENRSENTIITCDYCGSKVDTSKHSTCDHCGGPYWDDEEWKNMRAGL
ncbi:MAG: hypothetical protein IJ106_03715 [Parasporobacterium sp.]|nr:hypothetical protein [Parasporobacterium sp.]